MESPYNAWVGQPVIRRWHPEERVLLKSVHGGLRLQARVVYCQHLPSNTFAIGLDLFGPIREWGTPT